MPRPPIREKEVLKILASYGALSTIEISKFLNHKLSTKRLKALLRELRKKKLVRQLKLRIIGSPVAIHIDY